MMAVSKGMLSDGFFYKYQGFYFVLQMAHLEIAQMGRGSALMKPAQRRTLRLGHEPVLGLGAVPSVRRVHYKEKINKTRQVWKLIGGIFCQIRSIDTRDLLGHLSSKYFLSKAGGSAASPLENTEWFVPLCLKRRDRSELSNPIRLS